MENKNILLGGKDPKDLDSYRDILQFMKDDLKLMRRTWYLALKHPETGESYKCHYIHFRREYINQVADCLSKLDFDTLAQIPHDKDGCAYRLECRYLKSGKVFGMQIIEARVGSGGGFFSVTPTIVLLNEEGEKAHKALQKKL